MFLEQIDWKKNRVLILGIVLSLTLLGMAIYIHFFLADLIYERENGIIFKSILWRNYCAEGAVLVLIGAVIINRVRVSFTACVILALSVVLHYLGGMLDWYHLIDVWDHITHGLSHLGLIVLLIYWFQMAEDENKLRISPLIWLTIASLAAMGVGAVFEIREYAFSVFFHTLDQGGYNNTLQDLMFNAIGILVGVISAIMIQATWLPSGHRFTRYVGSEGKKLWYYAIANYLLLIVLVVTWLEKAQTLNKW